MNSFDSQPPRNLNDIQLYPAMLEYPPETRGITEMTFTLARCQITNMYRCMADSRRHCGNTRKSYAEMSQQERNDWIDSCEHEFSQKFFQNYSSINALHWVSFWLFTSTTSLEQECEVEALLNIEPIIGHHGPDEDAIP